MPGAPSAEDGLKHLLLFINEDVVYRAALGAYDLALAYMVVAHSQVWPTILHCLINGVCRLLAWPARRALCSSAAPMRPAEKHSHHSGRVHGGSSVVPQVHLRSLLLPWLQKDPGEFMLELQRFATLPEGPLRSHAIDMHLRR